ncbi:MAG TPA: hypothetical protein VEC99_03125 [Clostridia bacterium]|nr:hypothetical protein [Clostridia bacterium]
MSLAPERPIEKLLRRIAGKRREEAGAAFELHPATRRLLQDEVARQYGRQNAPECSQVSLFSRFWPWLAGSGFAAILLIWMAFQLFPEKRGDSSPLLARNDHAGKPTAAPRSDSIPAPALAPAKSADPQGDIPAKEVARLNGQNLQDKAESTQSGESEVVTSAEPPTSKQPAVAGVGGESAPNRNTLSAADQVGGPPSEAQTQTSAAFARRYGMARPTRERAETATASAASPDRARAGGLASNRPLTEELTGGKEGRVVQHFVQTGVPSPMRPNSKAEALSSPAVLASFQMELAGPELRVIDNDGSVYTGSVQAGGPVSLATPTVGAPTTASRARGTSRRLEAFSSATPGPDTQNPTSYYFKVTGTNRSLNQIVVFSGNLTGPLPEAAARSPANSRSSSQLLGRQTGQGTAQSNSVSILNAHISGTAVLGEGQPIPINAVPTSPQTPH